MSHLEDCVQPRGEFEIEFTLVATTGFDVCLDFSNYRVETGSKLILNETLRYEACK